MAKRIMLFTLHTFSTTGGLQKMARTLAYSLSKITKKNNIEFKLWSLYDEDNDLMPQYISAKNFKGFDTNKPRFLLKTLSIAKWPDVIIISHINLAMVGLIIKFINPKCKTWLIAHGIEVWRPLSSTKRKFLEQCDKVLCVSSFTKQELIKWHKVNSDKCEILNNAVDPFIKLPAAFDKPQYLLDKYNLSANTPVIFTLTRLASTEQYKGHDQVIKALKELKVQFPEIKYILAGRSDPAEKTRIKQLIAEYKVEEQVILTGFMDEAELPDYFLLADLFVLPSKKEGFGIVFIEALACGLPIICGNADGSIDAIRNGELGCAIKADDLEELEKAIAECLLTPLTKDKRQYLQKECLLHFNEDKYAQKLERLIADE